MQRRAPVYRRDYAVGQSSRAKSAYEELLKRAREAESDANRDRRLQKQECKCCFYVFASRVGGAAITGQDCALCHESQTYASTNTNVVCMTCAKENSLCTHCGGDLDMRERRRNWPTPAEKEES
jgi:hypothetical protein